MALRRYCIGVLAALLAGCATGGAGHYASVAGNTVVAGGAAYGVANTGNAAFGFRYGNPVPPGAPSASISVGSPEAAAVLVFGAALLQFFGGSAPPAAVPASPAPARVMHSCSCYGYQPDLTPTPPTE